MIKTSFAVFVILFFACIVCFIQGNSAFAQSNAQPTYGTLGPCPSCETAATPTIFISGQPVNLSPAQPTSSNISPIPSEDPCEAGSASIASHKSKSKHWRHHGDVSGFMETLLRFFVELLNLLLKLLGGGQIPTPNPNHTPSPSVIPVPTTSEISPTSSQPEPTQHPCPSTEPTNAAEPTNGAPTMAPSIQPTVSATTPQLPAQILNLTNWKLTLPIGASENPTEIKQPTLATYKNDPWFLVTNGGVRFRAPVNGITTSGSSYPRSELREMTNNGTTNANWSSSTGTHMMTIDQAITDLPTTKKHIVAGQIHDANDDVIVIRLEGTKLFIDIAGSDGPTLDPNYTLGKRFTVKFEVSNNQTKIYYNGNAAPAHTLNKSYSGAYFKAGAYTQSNCSTESSSLCTADNYGEVVIYSLSASHQ